MNKESISPRIYSSQSEDVSFGDINDVYLMFGEEAYLLKNRYGLSAVEHLEAGTVVPFGDTEINLDRDALLIKKKGESDRILYFPFSVKDLFEVLRKKEKKGFGNVNVPTAVVMIVQYVVSAFVFFILFAILGAFAFVVASLFLVVLAVEGVMDWFNK